MHYNVIVTCHKSTLAEYQLVAGWISEAMPNSQIKGEAFNSEELLKHMAIKPLEGKS